MSEDPKEKQGAERYQEILEQSNNTMKLFDRIESAQRGRRFRAWLRWWWYKLTFRGYINEREERKKENALFRREIERKARKIEAGGK
jgi:hypothetical protein